MKQVHKVGIVGGAVVGVYLMVTAFRPPVSLEKVHAIKEGMTEAQVRQILGEPTTIYSSGQWTYRHPLRFGYVNVLWKTNGTALYANHEEF